MAGSTHVFRSVSRVFWVLCITAIAIWSLIPGYVVGWDLKVYKAAIVSLQNGHDPYADAMAIQREVHAQLLAEHSTLPPGVSPPYSYVYSPVTLPLLRGVSHVPFAWSAVVYWLIYVCCVAGSLWAGWYAVEERERRVFALLAPVAVFFPGLLQQDTLFSGNIAFILYGCVLVAALYGWRRSVWTWFYLAVLIASCFKAPLLSLLAIPVLSARKQWVPAGITAVLGIGLFAMQPRIWPELFRHYLEAVELQFSFNRDFSSSPAGLLANALYNVIPYGITSAVFYLLYAAAVFGVLLYFRGKFLDGRFSLQQWIPVMMVGVILLNPRIMEYDVAPVTLMMALVLWRFFAHIWPMKRAVPAMSIVFAAINLAALSYGPPSWRITEGFVLAGLFLAGAWTLRAQVCGRESAMAAA